MSTIVAAVVGAVVGGSAWQAYLKAQADPAATKKPGAATSRYASLSSEELKERTNILVGQIQDMRDRFRQQSRAIRNAQDDEMSRLNLQTKKGKERASKLFKEAGDADRQVSDEERSTYDRYFKAESIALRDEYSRRMPEYKMLPTISTFGYEVPTNDIGMGSVVDDLSRRAKQLP